MSPTTGRIGAGRSLRLWTFAITCLALFMVVLDNLVVTNALPAIRTSLGAGVEDLEWTVNAYTLSFAVLLLTGAALGDRFGRRRMFALGLAVFTLASAAAALAPTIDLLVGARALQGAGAAMVMPLTLTLLADVFPPERRGMAIGAWSGVSGLGVAIGPLVGGAVVDGLSWQWIFWINVPIGVIGVPLALRRLRESRGPAAPLDLLGLGLISGGLLGIVWAMVRGNLEGWGSPRILVPLVAGVLLVGAFAWWERRAPSPMLPTRFFRSRAFVAANGVSLAMYFGMFGSIFLLAQFLQTAQGYSALEAGIRTLPWTACILVIAPLAGSLADRIGGRPLMVAGLTLQAASLAWLAAITAPSMSYGSLVAPFVMAGVGMALVFAPVATTVLGAVRPQEAGVASGANNAIRELGGVFGVAVMASVFSAFGGYASAQDFTAGLVSATWVGAAVVGVGIIAALLVPGRERAARADAAATPEAAAASAA